MTLHQTALDAGATYARPYEFNGRVEPEAYTMTPAQLAAIVVKMVEAATNDAYQEGRAAQAKLELAGRDKFLATLRATA